MENAYENNLLSDISEVDYLAGNQGRTNLRPLEGLPVFVEDVYVFGYLRREKCLAKEGRLSCTIGEIGSARRIVTRISIAVQETMGNRPSGEPRDHVQTSILHTNSTGGSTARKTIDRIERDTRRKALARWKERYQGAEPAGVLVAKVDVFEIPISELQAALPAFECQTLSNGYVIYSIDYTQDFSATTDRKAPVEHLCSDKIGFRELGDTAAANDANEPTVFANTDSVGRHVCT
ncbi:MAG: hypothetical protein G8D61_02870, partial [gamma proteobacterium symbiont of Ctena orbiculata]